MEYGIVYLLTNPYMPGLVKIGMTKQEDLDKRMKELYTTGVPVPFECQFACKVNNKDCAKIEKALHTAFDPQRVNKNREFFRINVEQAKAILELFHHTDVTEDVSEEIQNDLTDEDKAASIKAQATHRPPLNFFEMGMQKGDILQWREDPSIAISVYSGRSVLYDGKEIAISALTRDLKNAKYYVAPGQYWLFNGRLLSDIYDETYPFEE